MSGDKITARPLIETSWELYREICNRGRGLDPRAMIGRDDALAEELSMLLGIPRKSFDDEELRKRNVTVETFIGAFFSIAQPFSQMYSEILEEIELAQGKSADENLLIRFDFGSSLPPLSFDLRTFRKQVESSTKLAREISLVWGPEDLNMLFQVFEILRKACSSATHDLRSIYYNPGKALTLPPVPPCSKRLRGMLEEIRDLFYNISDDAEKERFHENEDHHAYGPLPMTLTDLIPTFSFILQAFEDELLERRFESEVNLAIARYEEIRNSLDRRARRDESLIKHLLDVLDLPMWHHRWYLYEIWATVQAIIGLKEYRAHLEVKDGQVEFRRGSETIVGTLVCEHSEKLELVAQRETPIEGVKGRRGIEPDLRICHAGGTRPEETLVAVEFKQRRRMSKNQIANLARLYDIGTPRAIANLFLNYDQFPDLKLLELSPNKTELIDFVRPDHPDKVQQYKEKLRESLLSAGYKPLVTFDAVLIDVSASMKELYTADALDQIERTLLDTPINTIWLFADTLMEPNAHNIRELCINLRARVAGGTQVQNALKGLLQRASTTKRLLLITDGGFTGKPDFMDLKVIQTLPQEAEARAKEALSEMTDHTG